MNKPREILTIILTFITILLAFLAGFLARPIYDQQTSKFPLLLQSYQLLKDNAYKELPAAPKLEYGAIHGMFQAYNDPFTVFVEPPQNEVQTDQLQGKYGGIGVRIERDPQGFVILFPFPDSPAQKAGVLDGDRLISVNQLQITPQTDDTTLQAAVRGPVGQIVLITVGQPPNYSPRELKIQRAEIALPSTTWNLATTDHRVGVIQVNVIAQTTPDEIEKAIANLQSQGAVAFILDLRNNGGGLLNAGIDTARLFLKDGIVIQQESRNQPVQTHEVTKPGPFIDVPLAILVNQGTASASEIIAGSLQQRGRAILVGVPTYGKNTFQQVFTLRDNSSVHITAGRWWIPGTDLPQPGKGLQPNILVQGNQDVDYISAAIKALGLH